MTYLIIEWTGATVTVSRFLRRRGALLFQGKGSRPATDRETLTEALRELVPTPATDDRLVLALPLAQLFSRELELPIRERRKLREVLPLELRGETALDGDELVFDGLLLGSGKVLALWGQQRELAELIGAAAAAGAEPDVVSAAPLHWGSLLPPEGQAGTVALCDGTALAVFRDGAPFFFRAVADGDPAAETARTLAALELDRGIAVERLYLLDDGGGANAAGSIPRQPLPVAGDLAAAFGGDAAAARSSASAWALAHAVAAGDAVDFRTGALASTKGRAQARRQLRLPMVLAILLVALLVADAGIRYTLVRRDLASLDASIGAIYRELFPNRKKAVDEVGELRAELRKLSPTAGGSAVLATLRRLAEGGGDGLDGLYEAEIDGKQVRLKGDARSAQAVTDFRNRLTGLFSSVDVGEIASRPDGGVRFTLRGTLKEGGP